MIKISLRKRSNGWEYRFQTAYVSGKQQFLSKGGFQSKKEAEEAGLLAQEEYAKGGIVWKNRAMSVSDFLDYWMKHYCAVNLKETTCAGYEKKVRIHLKPYLGHYEIGSISPLTLQDFINSKFEAGYSRNSLSVMKGVLSGAFAYAVSPAGFLPASPMNTVRLPNRRAKPKTPSRKKTRSFLLVEQWQRIIARFPEEHSCHIPLMLGYHLGLRLGEAFALCWDDVDFANGTLSINRQVQWNQSEGCWFFSEPKYNSFRTITMDTALSALLQRWHKKQGRGKAYYAEKYQQQYVNEHSHLGAEGEPINLITARDNGTYIQPRVTQHLSHVAHSQLDLPNFDFHTLRHTHATMLLEAGVNPVDIQERLGHAKLSMTWRYAHNTEAIRKQTAEIMDKLFACE